MITLDKIKIVSSIKHITITDNNRFDSLYKEDEVVCYRFTQLQPFLLFIEANRRHQELVIEFSGKILKDDYPSLINQHNIKRCLSCINELGFCFLDITGILTEGIIVKADITQDVSYPNCKELTKSLQVHIANFRKYMTRIINGNFIIEKNVTTKSYKRRLTIYDKSKELGRAENRQFLSLLSDKQKLLNYFEGKIRFELNLNSMEQIRQALHIHNLSIMAVLEATNVYPIWEFLNQIITDSEPTGAAKYNNVKDLLRWTFLQACDYDIEKVEAQLRPCCSPNTHITQVLKPFRELLKTRTNMPSINFKQTLRSLLLGITIS